MAHEDRKELKKEIVKNLKKTVNNLCLEIGSRSYYEVDPLNTAGKYIGKELKDYGYDFSTQPYIVEKRAYKNIIAERRGDKEPDKIVILGAHYDTVIGTIGADDNASAVAGMLETARLLKKKNFSKTVRFVAFTLEEPPAFGTYKMGSYVYARSLKKKKENIVGMICLEMIGYFTTELDSQSYPLPFFSSFYPDRGNFIALVSNLSSKSLLKKFEKAFKKGTGIPVESLATVSIVPGVSLSDHRSFWDNGYKALMVTDTAFLRNKNYHTMLDRPETLDYENMAEVVLGLVAVLEDMLN